MLKLCKGCGVSNKSDFYSEFSSDYPYGLWLDDQNRKKENLPLFTVLVKPTSKTKTMFSQMKKYMKKDKNINNKPISSENSYETGITCSMEKE